MPVKASGRRAQRKAPRAALSQPLKSFVCLAVLGVPPADRRSWRLSCVTAHLRSRGGDCVQAGGEEYFILNTNTQSSLIRILLYLFVGSYDRQFLECCIAKSHICSNEKMGITDFWFFSTCVVLVLA